MKTALRLKKNWTGKKIKKSVEYINFHQSDQRKTHPALRKKEKIKRLCKNIAHYTLNIFFRFFFMPENWLFIQNFRHLSNFVWIRHTVCQSNFCMIFFFLQLLNSTHAGMRPQIWPSTSVCIYVKIATWDIYDWTTNNSLWFFCALSLSLMSFWCMHLCECYYNLVYIYIDV